jgi:hypothetical protein
MRTVWKYNIAIQDIQTIGIPSDPQPLCVQMQGAGLCVWFEVDTDRPLVRFRIGVVGTGNPLPEEWGWPYYIGTVQDGPLVWHVYGREEQDQ